LGSKPPKKSHLQRFIRGVVIRAETAKRRFRAEIAESAAAKHCLFSRVFGAKMAVFEAFSGEKSRFLMGNGRKMDENGPKMTEK
jgi:hypothetical protein